ncbi:hypothetical protein FA10DRAFT_263961 [Acaromyces ingoldii]|uniref:BSD domain-containing protein n=1 Tax=Acaromyces ingoldii TaxID=215250 RepID=A0A316YV54_9BASI|nr:hypothetical protein FA10DRAFT_263961 [Acaromyces ingoldii]PWN93297.1 hypothetical protein FA10DRAFT_263961 [Acaromyces ingoldii]
MASQQLHAAASWQKLAGSLSLEESSGILRWQPSSSSSTTSPIVVAPGSIIGILISKPDAPRVSLKVRLNGPLAPDDKDSVLFEYTGGGSGDRQRALDDRERFKDRLSEIASKNKASTSTSNSTSTSTPAAVPSPAPASPAVATSIADKGKARASPAVSAEKRQREELDLRIRVLQANPTLALLHRQVVMSKQITDVEFWSHPARAALLNAERASASQRAGRNARIADPRPSTNEAGETRINMTPELVRDLKAQFPVVARAFEENVPEVMEEEEFWRRYFSSKLYHRLRSSARSKASQHIIKQDDVFDRYLEDEDDGIEPRRKQFDAHDRFLDLGATAEDHQETGNEKDWTMRAGGERKTLPLIRRFNDHSQSLLDSALGEQEEAQRRKRKKTGGVDQEYGDGDDDDEEEEEEDSRIVIEELGEEGTTQRQWLDMRDQRQLFESRMGGTNARVDATNVTESDVRRMVDSTRAAWSLSLSDFDAGDAAGAMKSMLSNIRARNEARALRGGGADLPSKIQSRLTSSQATTTEFLRHFWAAIAPQPSTSETTGGGDEEQQQTPKERKVKAAKMSAKLASLVVDGKTVPRKRAMEDMERDAEQALPGSGRERVRAALGPTEQAVRRALTLAQSQAGAQ